MDGIEKLSWQAIEDANEVLDAIEDAEAIVQAREAARHAR